SSHRSRLRFQATRITNAHRGAKPGYRALRSTPGYAPCTAPRCGLLSDHVVRVSFVLANILEQLSVRHQVKRHLCGPGLCISFRVIEGELNFPPSKVETPHTLGNFQCCGVGVAAVIEPCSIIDPHRLDNKRVVFPSPDRVAKPGGIAVLGERATIGMNLPVVNKNLVEHKGQLRSLNNLEWIRWQRHAFGNTLR